MSHNAFRVGVKYWQRAVGFACAAGGAASLYHTYPGTQLANSERNDSTCSRAEKPSTGRLVVLGCGSSTGVPRPFCLFDDNKDSDKCKVSRLALLGPPEENRNYRGNPSLLVQTPAGKTIQIDVGKTFRENAVRWYPRFGVNSVDAVILTHGHADAIFGMDDLRGLQGISQCDECEALPVFLDAPTLAEIKRSFPYLMPKSQEGQSVKRWVAALDFKEIKKFQPFTAADLEVTPVPVMHGEDLVSLGFCFGEKERVVYLSDVSRVLPETERFLKQRPIDVLIVDALFKERRHSTHFSLPEALEFIRKMKPRRAVLVGLSDDIEYHSVNRELAQLTDINVELAYDGLSVDVAL
mmetsp:Transcript_2556/g.5324  ORF Transcript_2556/g.5324 Transcript_2556/m.5324 type:complete len:352 (-) Transcript_2556:313-1368(-)|eukprot:CAMPEP_0118935672 /NCGR_PEP_ID=MMETSP1169-20130426/15771_1 /TAXON_ID=36882 /ORGANISM="Pyramimonas obovata, Strain CCMP722" /LENGTH=351 /DNA_ID=CAMNT_0006878731 /DNA_START=125 /DNA_END=1180 /DNA_ORIENTATION=+